MGTLKIRYKAQALLVGSLVLISLILINALIQKSSIRLDLTQDKEYTLSESTKKILASLDDTVTIKLYFSSDAPSRISPILKQVRDLVSEFRLKGRGKVNVQTVDPASSPESEQETQMLGIPPLQLNVVEKDKAEVRKIYLGIGLFYADKKEILPVVSEPTHLEYDLTSSILKLTSEAMPKIGILKTGEDFSLLQDVLRRQMTVIPLDTAETAILEKKLDALLIVNPLNASPEFVKQVEFAFEAGVPVILFSSGIQVNPQLQGEAISSGFEQWLEGKGIKFKAPLVIDPKYVGRAAFSSGIVQYQMPYPFFVHLPREALDTKHPVTNKLENILFPWTSSLTILDNKDSPYTYTTLAESSTASILQEGEPSVSPQALENLNITQGESYPIAVVAESKEGHKKLIVVANDAFVKNNFLNDFEGNLIFFQNAVDWATRGDALIGIRSRGKTLRPLPVFSSGTIELLRWSHLILSPLLFILAGYLIRRQRTNKLIILAKNM